MTGEEARHVMGLVRGATVHARTLVGSMSAATHVVRNVLSRHPRDVVLASPEAMEAMLSEMGQVAAQVVSIRRDEPQEGVDGAVMSLPFEEREALSLSSVFGLGTDAIARVTHSSEAEARARLSRAMAAVDAGLAGPR